MNMHVEMPQIDRSAPPAWLRTDVPDDERTPEELVREWKFVRAQMTTDCALVGDEDKLTDQIADKAFRRMHEIEEALAAADATDQDGLQGMLSIVIANLAEQFEDGREVAILRNIHRCCNLLRNAARKAVTA